MRITELQADNILAIKTMQLTLEKPNLLICGSNGTMKSSIADTLSMALAHMPMRGVTQKQDYGLLVHDGAKAGGGMVVIDGDVDNARQFNLPKGEFTGPEIPEAMRVALHGQAFARMKEDERRAFLCALTNVRPTKAVVQPLLLAAGDGESFAAMVEEVLPNLRAGFQSACDYAKEKAADFKRDWCKTTGSKAYGAKIAESWQAPMPDAPTGDEATLKQELADVDTQIATLNQSLGAIQQAAAQAKADADARASLANAAGKVDSLGEQLALAQKELADYLPKVEALRQRAAGKARVGLVHDLAMFVATADIPSLGAEQEEKALHLIHRYEAEHGKLEDMAAVDAEAQAALPDHEKGLTVLQNRAQNLQRDLAAATQAKAQFDVLAPAAEAVDPSTELAEVNELLAGAKQQKQAVTNKILDIQAALKNRADAGLKNADAARQHAAVTDWLKIAEQLAPSGIPAQLLKQAIGPVNEKLHQASVDTEWPRVTINEDMSITCGGRLYQLQSESYQWRADAMIAQVVAEISGLKLLMLDRVDVLDLRGRAELFSWLDMLVEVGALDCSIIFATLKEQPAPGVLPETFESHWVADGVITNRKPLEQAA
jgi:hypothetical protein